MKYHVLNAVVNGKPARLKRCLFISRNDAIKYTFDYYDDHYLYGLEVHDEYPADGDKHNVEYVCNFHNRFTINRVVR